MFILLNHTYTVQQTTESDHLFAADAGVFLKYTMLRNDYHIHMHVAKQYFMTIILHCKCKVHTLRSQQMEKFQTEMLNVAFTNNIFTGALHIKRQYVSESERTVHSGRLFVYCDRNKPENHLDKMQTQRVYPSRING